MRQAAVTRNDSRRHGGASYDEIAEALAEEFGGSYTKQAVYQIQQRALWKIKKLLERQGLTLSDFLPDAEPDTYWNQMIEV